MKSRMDRYSNDSNSTNSSSRTDKNKDLYGDLYSNVRYAEIVDLNNNEPYEIRVETANEATREKYQRLKEYKNLINREYKEEKIQPITKEETRVYDINLILEEAKKERRTPPVVSNENFHQFAEVSGIFKDGKSDEIKELINTITSSSLRKDIDRELSSDDLLGDLLPEDDSQTMLLDPVESEQHLENFIHEDDNYSNKGIDKTFYTKSMEFSDKDFEKNNHPETDEDNEKSSIIIRILTVISVLLIVGGMIFVIVKYIL